MPKAKRTRGRFKPSKRSNRSRQITSRLSERAADTTHESSEGSPKARSRSQSPLIPKDQLAQEIATIIRYHHLSQTEAARVVGDAASQISLLMAGKIEGFSTERLLRILLRLGRDIELVFRPASNPRAAKFRISHKSKLAHAS